MRSFLFLSQITGEGQANANSPFHFLHQRPFRGSFNLSEKGKPKNIYQMRQLHLSDQPTGKWSWVSNFAQRKHKVGGESHRSRKATGGNLCLDIKPLRGSLQPFRAVLLVGAHADWARGEQRRICRPAPRLSPPRASRAKPDSAQPLSRRE